MIIDGNKIAGDIKAELKSVIDDILKNKGRSPKISLGVVLVGNNPVSLRYVDKKKTLGEEIGVNVNLFHFDEKISEDELIRGVNKAVRESDGVIIQLPLPKHLETQKILNLVPKEKDVDCLSEACISEGKVFSPVVEAIKEILDIVGVKNFENKKVVIVGRGRLVGKPVFEWLKRQDADVLSFSKDDSEKMYEAIKNADILILSAGQPDLIKPEMLKDGVILIDASTSDVSGQLKGDAEPSCAPKCSVFTPVPGGVGPMTVILLFRNLVELRRSNK